MSTYNISFFKGRTIMAIDNELLAISALVGLIFLTINTDRKVSDQQLIEGRKGDDTDDKVKARQNQLDDIQKDITKNQLLLKKCLRLKMVKWKIS